MPAKSTEPEADARLPSADIICGWIVKTVGLLSLLIAGSNVLIWCVPSLHFIAAWPNVMVMRVNTGIALSTASISLLIWHYAPRPTSGQWHWQRIAASAFASVACLIGGLTTWEYLAGTNPGIDTFFSYPTFPEDQANSYVVMPGRMSLNAALSLFFLGVSLMGVDWTVNFGRARRVFISPIAAVTSALPACFGLVGYLSGTGGFTGILKSTNVLMHAALALVLVAIGVLALRSERNPVRRILSSTAGGILLRWLLPGSTLSLMILAWGIGKCRAIGIVATGEGTALMLFGGLILLYTLIVAASRAVDEEEAKAHHAKSALLEEEQRSRSILETSLDGVVLMDSAGRVATWNRAAEDIFGWPRDEIIGQVLAEYIVPERLRGAHSQGLENYLQQGFGPVLGNRLELPAIRRDGTEFQVELSIAVVDNAVPPMFVGFIRDITARKMAEQALLEAKDYAEKASQAKDDFLAALSHELRTPLTPVLLSAADLTQDTRLPEDVRQSLAMMERHVTLEARLIDDLLDLTRISRGKLLLRNELCDLSDLLRHAVTIVQDDADGQSLKIEADLEILRGTFFGDPARLQQVFWNLLKNAVKFTPPGGVITVRSRLVKSAGSVIIEVSDTGVGFTPERADQLFLPFEQEKSGVPHLFGGLGLGLAIARAIVTLHGGEIHASSPGLGQGAVFTVSLPYSLDSNPSQSSAASPELSSEEVPNQTFHILLVEDNEPTRQVLERLLKRAGHRVTARGDIAEAMHEATVIGTPFDVLVSDLGLPDGSGMDLMQQLREHQIFLPGIALSGYGMEEDQIRSREAGFLTHLVKPIKFDQLLQALAEVHTPGSL